MGIVKYNTSLSFQIAPVAQWIEHWIPNPCAAGPIPAGGTIQTLGNPSFILCENLCETFGMFHFPTHQSHLSQLVRWYAGRSLLWSGSHDQATFGSILSEYCYCPESTRLNAAKDETGNTSHQLSCTGSSLSSSCPDMDQIFFSWSCCLCMCARKPKVCLCPGSDIVPIGLHVNDWSSESFLV